MDADAVSVLLPVGMAVVLGAGAWFAWRRRARTRRVGSRSSIVEPDLSTPVRDVRPGRRGLRRRRQMDPRGNGHAKRDPGA